MFTKNLCLDPQSYKFKIYKTILENKIKMHFKNKILVQQK